MVNVPAPRGQSTWAMALYSLLRVFFHSVEEAYLPHDSSVPPERFSSGRFLADVLLRLLRKVRQELVGVCIQRFRDVEEFNHV